MASPSPIKKHKTRDIQIQINQNLKTDSNFNKQSQKGNLEYNLIQIERKDLIKAKQNQLIDPDFDTLSRNDIMMESREDLIEVKGEIKIENLRTIINISDLEMTPCTPEGISRQLKSNHNEVETNYSQVFNLQNINKLEHQVIKPTDTVDKKTLESALKPPLQQKEGSSRYNSHQTSINRKRMSNTELEQQHKPQSNSSINVKQRGKTGTQNGKTIDTAKREHSIQSNGSKQESHIRMLQGKTQQITTPRGKLIASLGDGMFNKDESPSVSPNKIPSSPQSRNDKRQNKDKKIVTKMASQLIDVKNPENTYLPQIEQRQSNKSPMRQIQKPPMPAKNERIESLNLTKTKFGNGQKGTQKNNKKKDDFKSKPHKTQFESITHKIELAAGDSSSDVNENMKELVIGKQFKLRKENSSLCTDYCQYRGQQIPKKYKSIFTPNKYRKVEGGIVLSQRLFLSNECAESEDRRMLPILVINLDGAMGYWDDYNKFHYVLRPKIVDSLIQLSYDFRLIAVSSKKQKYLFRLIYGLINVNEDGQSKHLYFDAVYQLGSSTEEKNEMCTIKNIEEIQFDLTQALLDMQFKRQQNKRSQLDTLETNDKKDEFLTFWESKLYRPHNKVIIFTTERYLNKNHCYSFDYNYLYQATKFKNESSKKSPIIIQLPHLRVNPKISFEIIHQLIFALQNITQAISTETQDRSKIVDGKYYENPEISSFQVCKKFLSFKWNVQEKKMRGNGSVKGYRVFDSNYNPYVDLGNVDFNESYKFIKKYFANRKSNWLKIQKYYLNTKQSKIEKIHKLKLMAKVSFNDSPEIIRMGEDNGSQKIAIGTTHDSSKAESNHQRANQYMSDDAKNLYNGLMIRNFKMQQEINAYARHHRILFQHKMAKQKQEEIKLEAQLKPIVIFDGEEEGDDQNPKSGLRQYGQLKSSINHDNKEKISEMLTLLQQAKQYAFKFRTLIVRSHEFYEQWNTQDCDLSKFTVIDIKQKVNQESFERKGGAETNQDTARRGKEGDGVPKSNLIDYLARKQGRIPYQTSQETHLKNNLSQLVDGRQQYVDQQKELQEQDKEQLPSINDKDANQNLHQNYLDLI